MVEMGCDDDVHMVRHHNPGMKGIPNALEVQQRIRHDSRDVPLPEQAFATIDLRFGPRRQGLRIIGLERRPPAHVPCGRVVEAERDEVGSTGFFEVG